VADIEAIGIGHRIQADRINPAGAGVVLRHFEHDVAEALPLPRRIDGYQAKHRPPGGLEVDPDGAGHFMAAKENQRLVSGAPFIRVIGIVLAMVLSSFAVVFLKQAPPANVVIAVPVVRALGRPELETMRAHRATLL
jgi:hypothetical protein